MWEFWIHSENVSCSPTAIALGSLTPCTSTLCRLFFRFIIFLVISFRKGTYLHYLEVVELLPFLPWTLDRLLQIGDLMDKVCVFGQVSSEFKDQLSSLMAWDLSSEERDPIKSSDIP